MKCIANAEQFNVIINFLVHLFSPSFSIKLLPSQKSLLKLMIIDSLTGTHLNRDKGLSINDVTSGGGGVSQKVTTSDGAGGTVPAMPFGGLQFCKIQCSLS